MSKVFKHPLARDAKVWPAKMGDGEHNILVIITTINLDADGDRKSKRLVEKLSKAAADHVQQLEDVSGFMLMNRAKDWVAPTE
jgi:hypothetical protein